MNLLMGLILILSSTMLHSEDKVDLKVLKKLYTRPKDIPYIAENPYSESKVILGKSLFFDPRLSGSNAMSCATCHNPSFSWGDSLPKAVGQGHQVLERKTPTILNLAWTEKMMWDGRAGGLESQALGPIESSAEMNMDLSKLTDRISNIEGYVEMFNKAFPGEKISNDLIANALAMYQRTIVSGSAPFDRWINGHKGAISKDAINGFVLFNTKARCMTCHSGWRFTDDSFHDVGLKSDDIGRGKFLRLNSQQHAFKTPGLRNITQRAPYMHNGSLNTLMDVVSFYNDGGQVKRKSLSSMIFPLGLTKTEKFQLVEFLKTLTSNDKPVELPVLPVAHIE